MGSFTTMWNHDVEVFHDGLNHDYEEAVRNFHNGEVFPQWVKIYHDYEEAICLFHNGESFPRLGVLSTKGSPFHVRSHERPR
jgi:hypothetical protein